MNKKTSIKEILNKALELIDSVEDYDQYDEDEFEIIRDCLELIEKRKIRIKQTIH